MPAEVWTLLDNYDNNNGYKFFIYKTYKTFCNRRKLHADHLLTFYKYPILVTAEFKFIGVIFDSKRFFYSILTILKLKPWKA